MKKIRWGNSGGIKAVVAIFVLSLTSPSFGTNGDEELLRRAKENFGTLPQVILSGKNPITPEKVKLGKILFYESRISVDGTVSCVRCHPMGLYGADGLKKSIGNHAKVNPRNAPTIFNAAGQIAAHWIGNRTDVEDQAKQSVIGPPSYGMPSYEAVEKKLGGIKGYLNMFKRAFPDTQNPITVDHFAQAVGAFERTLVTPSPFDGFLKGDLAALKEKGKSGLKAFMEAGCVGCHSGLYLGGQMYEKFGSIEPYWKFTKSEAIDEGRFAVSKEERDRYVFKVPGLRNVAKTPPLFSRWFSGSVGGCGLDNG